MPGRATSVSSRTWSSAPARSRMDRRSGSGTSSTTSVGGDIPAPTAPGKDLPLTEAREAWFQAFAQEYLTDLLRRHGGNISQAAKTAGVDRKTLHRLLTKHGIRA